MIKKNYKGKCLKKAVSKCEGVCRTYDVIADKCADELSNDMDVKSFRCNVLLDGFELGEYTTDFVITKEDGSLAAAECIRRIHITKKTALCIRQEGSNISPTIYTDDLYSTYCDGKDVTELVEQVSRSISQSIKEAPEVPEITLENAKKNIILTLINVERNQKLLENTPHMLVGGEQSAIAAIPRWKVGPNASFVVNRGIARLFMSR